MKVIEWSKVHCYWARIVRNGGGLWFECGTKEHGRTREWLAEQLWIELDRIFGGIKGPDGTYKLEPVIGGEVSWYWHPGKKDHIVGWL